MSEASVIIWRQGAAGRIRLNRPTALNALTLEMVRSLRAALDAWADDPSVAVVLLDGAGERGLCAGGDIRALHGSIASDSASQDDAAWRFLFEEYRLNARIAGYPKPFVALMDGIVMGGGVGVSAHGSHRLVTETTRLAMPEVGIGFLPDVGGTWLLGRAPGQTGLYIGLTGERLAAADAISAGFADIAIAAAAWPDLAAALATLHGPVDAAMVWSCIDRFAAHPEAGALPARRALIDRCFAQAEIEDILAALDNDGSEFAVWTAQQLRNKSPTCLKLSLRAIREARHLTLEQALVVELRCAMRLLRAPDFDEGVRAAVIDRSRVPVWRPAALAQVRQPLLDRFFETLGEADLRFD